MSDPRDDLAELAADLRVLLDDAVARGVGHELAPPPSVEDQGLRRGAAAAPASPVGQRAPGASPPTGAPSAGSVEAPRAPVARPSDPAVGAVRAWGAVAAAARAEGEALTGAAGVRRARDELGDCRRCPLCRGRKNLVFGVGDPEADLLIVGEGPGAQEDLKGEPFVGPAGEMLDKMLVNVLGLDRDEVYICNVVKCRPPGNRDPEPDEIAACRPFLDAQLAAVRPKVILVLGRIAMQTLLGLDGVKRNRGSWRDLGGVPALVTFHPAYLLRTPEDKRLVFDDLKALRRRYDELGGKRTRPSPMF